MANVAASEVGFFLDGKRKDQRAWTATDAKAVPIIVSTGEVDSNDTAFGFSSAAGFENWLAKQPFASEYGKAEALLNRTPKELSPQKEKEISVLQADAVARYTNDFAKILGDAKVSVTDAHAVRELVTNFNPLTGPLVHSALLYEHINDQGRWLFLPSWWSWPRLSWLLFADTCSSVQTLMSWALLWEHPWYGGRRIVIQPAKNVNIDRYPYYFNDMASSAVTW
ncbi:MAG: hypothetical protein QOI58_4169 [Thermoanaerobaculia bacterium]|jgi:hypothetical protein|nr:hypothetical protein [Thermoanaerobaculia bacterium]